MSDAIVQIQGTVWQLLPELILIIAACIHFAVGPFMSRPGEAVPSGTRHRWGATTVLALAFAFWAALVAIPTGPASASAQFCVDPLSTLVRLLSLSTGLILLLISWNQTDDETAAEHHACLLLIVMGVNLVGLANDLVVLFLALELVSIPTYLLLYLGRRNSQGEEATIKYFLLSVFSSAIVLFGFSYLYGIAGSTNLVAIKEALSAGSTATMPAVIGLAMVMVLVGLGFRLTAVPFHFYAPDVMQGSSDGGAALLSFVPKIAGLVALIRLLILAPIEPVVGALWTPIGQASLIIGILAIASMSIGNFLALQQKNIRRLLAWSSVAHAGYLLVGLSMAYQHVGPVPPITAMLFYLLAYGAMTVGAFAVLAMLHHRDRRAESIDDLAGLSQTSPGAALMMTIFLLSLTGLPPTVGFLGKWNLFLAAWSSGSELGQVLAVVMAVNAAIAAWYYLRVIGVMYLQNSPSNEKRIVEFPAFVGAVICAALTLILFAAPSWLWHWIDVTGF